MRRFKKKLDGTVVELFPASETGMPWAERYQGNTTFKPKDKAAPKKKRHKSSIKLLDELLWNLTSEYIRRRDADEHGMVKCITCNTRKHWKRMQAGHWLTRALMPTKFLEQNINGQCVRCNKYLSGMQDQHGLAIDRKYGPGTTVRIRELSVGIANFTVADYHEMIRTMKQKLSTMPELPENPR